MVLKIISLIFVISLTFGITTPNQVKDVPFDVNEVLDRVNNHRQVNPPIPNPEIQIFDQGEFLVDTTIVYIPAPRNQEFPSIAFDGINYLIVWHDFRGDTCDIYGARVTQSGVILDQIGIAISTADNNQFYPSVAFDGLNYLVVWEDHRSIYGSDIYGTRVNQAGVILDTNGFVISADPYYQARQPSVGFDGTNYLVVWEDNRNGNCDIYGSRVSQFGVILDPGSIPISTARYWQSYLSIAFDGTNYLVVWLDRRSGASNDVYGARVTQSGVVLDTNGIIISTAGLKFSPTVTFGDSNYLVAWEEASSIFCVRVNQSGIVIDETAILISSTTTSSAKISFDGTNYLVVWKDNRFGYFSDIYGARVSQSGLVIDPSGIPISTARYSQYFPSIAFDGTNYLVVWKDQRIGQSCNDIFGARVNQSGLVLDFNGIVISTAANSQYSPSVAFDGTNYLVVWQEYINSPYNYDIYGILVNPSIKGTDSIGIVISTAINDQMFPSVTFDGLNYLVVWEDKRNDIADIYGARVSQIGQVLDTFGIAISTASYGQSNPAVTSDGENSLVVWSDQRGASYAIYGARVNQIGEVLDTAGFAISTSVGYISKPSIAFDGSNYFIAWEDGRSGYDLDIYGACVTPSGIVLDSGIAISTAVNYQLNPSIAFDGINYMVLWHDYRNGYYSDIYGTRVTQTGIVLDSNGFAISDTISNQTCPALVFDGTNYFASWVRKSDNDTTDIYGAVLDLSGIVIDIFPITFHYGNQESPSLAHGVGNEILITYQGWTDEYQGRAYNTIRIWGKFYLYAPGIEEENSKVTIRSAKLLEVYPNPAKNVMRVHGPFSEKAIKIFDISGKMIKEIATTASLSRNDGVVISLKGINPGIYFLRVGKETKKFIVTR